MASAPSRLRMAGFLLLGAAFALFVLAFTRFDGDVAPQPGAPGFAEFERAVLRDAQVSVVVGLAGCFVLLGAFACFDRARRAAGGPVEPPGARP